jgi:hypothetical protein
MQKTSEVRSDVCRDRSIAHNSANSRRFDDRQENLSSGRTVWWSWEDSNLQPSGYCQEMGEAQCNHSPNIDQRLTKKTPAAISVGETVGPLSWGLAKCWSEWQDLLFLCLPTDFPKLFQAALVVCVPTLCTECNLRRLRYATTEVIPKALSYCWPPLCGGDEVAFGGGPIVLNFAFCSSLSEA